MTQRMFHGRITAAAPAGEKDAPGNPVVCPYCQTPNPPKSEQCQACGTRLVKA